MKVLHINKYYYIKGGAESVFFNTEKILEEMGHSVIPFSLKSSKNKLSPYESYFVEFPELSESSTITKIKKSLSFFYNKKSKQQIEHLIKKEKPDIAHIHLLFNGISVSILPTLKKYNIPIIMTLHDYRLICPAYTFRNGKDTICEKCGKYNYFNCIRYRCSSSKGIIDSAMLTFDMYFRNLFFPIHKYIDSFIFVSKFSQKKHHEFLRKKTRDSIHLYNFYPSTIPDSIKQETIDEKHNSYFLYYGRLSREKGIEILLEVAQKLPSINFLFIGTGPYSSVLKQYSNINWLGYKTGEELFEYVEKAKFTIVPSTWYENNPMTIIESQSLGTPVIGADIGGIPELIQNNENGYLFEMGNINDLKEKILLANKIDKEKYTTMSKNSLSFAKENYNKNSYYDKLLQHYESIINRKNKYSNLA